MRKVFNYVWAAPLWPFVLLACFLYGHKMTYERWARQRDATIKAFDICAWILVFIIVVSNWPL